MPRRFFIGTPRSIDTSHDDKPYEGQGLSFEPRNGPDLSPSITPFTSGLAGVDGPSDRLFTSILALSVIIVLTIAFVLRWAQLRHAYIRQLSTIGDRRDQRYWMFNHSYMWPRVKRDILLAPLGKERHSKPMRLSNAVSIGALPSRLHCVLILLYSISNLVYCVMLRYKHQSRAAVLADLRGRTGVLALVNLIPTTILAFRDNPLISILKISYDTSNLLHRWCARIVVLETVLHTICWAINVVQAGGMQNVKLVLSESPSYQWGMVATSVLIFIAITASGPVRHAFYEMFLLAHRALVMIGLVGIYVHLDKSNLPQLPYVQLCIGFVLLAWVWRWIQVVYYNLSRRKGLTRMTIEALPAEACRVTIKLSRARRWQPGSHVHVYLPAYGLWSSHPFSVAWAGDTLATAPVDSLEMEIEKNVSVMTAVPGASAVDVLTPSSAQANSSPCTTIEAFMLRDQRRMQRSAEPSTPYLDTGSITLIIRARSGMTRKLFDQASATPEGKLTTWGAVEGPYGGHETFSSYGTVVLFAGGVGITHCISLLRHLLLQYQLGTCSTQKILLIWSIRHIETLEWVRVWMQQILRMEHRRKVLRIQLFVTKPRFHDGMTSSTGYVEVSSGRCNPSIIIRRELQDRIGAVGVTACGPGALTDSVRMAVRETVTESSIDFVEEAFTY